MFPARKRSSSSRRGSRNHSKRNSKSRSRSRSRSRRGRKSEGGKPPSIKNPSNSLISATTLDSLFVAAGKKHGVDGKLRVKASAEKERDVVHAAVMDSFKVPPAPPGASRPQQVLLGVITTAPIETMGVMSALKDPVAYCISVGVTTWDCYVGTFFGVRAVVVKSDQGPSGSHGSINATSFLISQWSVKTIWAIGIALGADPKGQKHGDVLASIAVQVYETREQTGSDGKKNITLSHAPWTVTNDLKSVVESTCASWKSGDNKAHAGLVVSAPKLLDDASATAEQLGVVRKAVPTMPVIGGEMEMGGVISVCLGSGVPWGVVKGICDFGGLDKAKSKEYQPLATMNAVAWMGAAIGNGSWIRSIPTPALAALHVMSFDEYMEKKRNGFVGRTELFGKMEGFSGGRVLLIKGEAGIGKSALMSQFVARNEGKGKIMALHFCQFGDGSTLDSERWLRSVSGQIMRWASQHNIAIPDKAIEELLDDTTDISSRFDGFSRAFPQTAPPAGTGSVWIVVDSLDEAVQAGGARSGFDIVRAIGSAHFPSWIRIVASTRSDPTVMAALEREIKNVVVMESSSEENMRDIRTWLTTAGGVTKESTTKAVLEASGGNFLYVRQLVVDGDVEKRVNNLPSGLVGIYSARAKALWEDVDEFEGDVPVLSVLVAARAPVPLELLKVAAKAAAGGGRVNVKRIVEYLKSVLDVGRDGAVRVFHKSFVDWCVTVGYDGIKAEVKDGHKGIWAACSLNPTTSQYAVRHGIGHGARAGVEPNTLLALVGGKARWGAAKVEQDSLLSFRDDIEACGGSEPLAKAMVDDQDANIRDLGQVAEALRQLGFMRDAASLYRHVLAKSEDQDVEMGMLDALLNNFGLTLSSQGKYQEALDVYKKSLDLVVRRSGRESVRYAETQMNIGILLFEQEKVSEAIEMLEESRQLKARLVGTKAETYAKGLMNLASAYMKAKNFPEAQKLYEESRDIIERTAGKESPDYGWATMNLAILAKNQGRLEEAAALFEESLGVTSRTIGRKSESYAMILVNLATIYLGEGKLLEAKGLQEEALGIMLKTVGDESYLYINALFNLSLSKIRLGEFEEAVADMKESFDLSKRVGLPITPEQENALRLVEAEVEKRAAS